MGDSATAPGNTRFSFAVARNVLVEALQRAKITTEKRMVLPILQAVLVETGPGSVKLSTTDLEQFISTTIPGVAVDGSGSIAISFARLSEVVTNLPKSGVVAISVVGKKIKLTCGRAKFELSGLPADEWPTETPFKPTLEATLDARSLIGALRRGQPHAGGPKQKENLQGALLEAADDGLFVVCARSFSVFREQIAPSSTFRAKSTIPRFAFASIEKLFPTEEALRVESTAQRCRMIGARSTYTFSLIAEEFAAYRRVIELASKFAVIAPRNELMEALKRVGVAAENDRVKLTFNDDAIAMSGAAADVGSAEDMVTSRMAAEPDSRSSRVTSVAADAMISALGSIDAEEILIEYQGMENPLYFRDAKSTDRRTVSMIAVMRTPLEAKRGTRPTAASSDADTTMENDNA